MEKELQSIPTEKDFNLSKVKLLPKGGIQAEYQVTQIVDGKTSLIDRNETCPRDVHPDLTGLFEDLRNIVARTFNITSFLSLLESDEMKLPESKKMLARSFADELIQKIEVRGVAWSGTGDKSGVVITAVYETANGLKTCINTPRIVLATISFGFEEELETIVESIKKEVYAYLFRGKQAQLSLFGEQAPAGESGTAENNELDFGPGGDMPEM